MKKIFTYFLKGLLVLAPIVATIYVVSYVFNFIDNIGQNLVSKLTGYNIPWGVGLLLTILLIVLVGLLSNLWISRYLIDLMEKIIAKFPGIKTIYNMVKESLQSFTGEKRSFSKVVLLTEADGAKRIGFLTTEDLSAFHLGDEYVSVYVPHGMQVSGELKMYRRDELEFIDTPVEEALRFCLTAGISGSKTKGGK